MHEAGDQERLLTNILLAITDSKNLHYVNYIEVFGQGNVRDLTYIYGSQNVMLNNFGFGYHFKAMMSVNIQVIYNKRETKYNWMRKCFIQPGSGLATLTRSSVSKGSSV